MNPHGTAVTHGCTRYVSVGSPPGPTEEQPVLLTAGISLLPQELGYLPSKYSRHPGLKAASSLKHNHGPAKEKQGAPRIASGPTGGK